MASHERKSLNARVSSLSTETVQSAALSLEGVDDIEGRDRLSLGVLSVGDSVSDNTFEEGLQNTAGLLVDHCLERVSDRLPLVIWERVGAGRGDG